MSETPDGRPRPTPRPRPGGKPSPRPRVAGSRRERDEPGARPEGTARPAGGATTVTTPGRAAATARPRTPRIAKAPAATPASGRRLSALALVLALLCLGARPAAATCSGSG